MMTQDTSIDQAEWARRLGELDVLIAQRYMAMGEIPLNKWVTFLNDYSDHIALFVRKEYGWDVRQKFAVTPGAEDTVQITDGPMFFAKWLAFILAALDRLQESVDESP